jgi:Membrane protein TerC, possibly involved in tellurium resistance
MELLMEPEVWLAFLTLTLLEIVLGIDNIIFISILVGRLSARQQAVGRNLGLSLAMLMRIGLLLTLTWIMKLNTPLFTLLGNEISGRDLILIIGGAFLLAKSTLEIHNSLEGAEERSSSHVGNSAFIGVVVQIGIIDIVFSLDSVITAVGLVKHIEVMIAAIIVSVLVMMAAAYPISRFIEQHPTLKMLALSFLILIGLALIGEGFNFHIPKGYIYFAMAFSVVVEMLNIKARKRKAEPIRLRKSVSAEAPAMDKYESPGRAGGLLTFKIKIK